METTPILRRRGDLDTWHLRPDCSRWPADGTAYESLPLDEWSPAKHGLLCNQCRTKEEAAIYPVAPPPGREVE